MSRMMNPTDKQYDGGGLPRASAGKKILGLAGISREKHQGGKSYYRPHWVVLEDLEDGGSDEGCFVNDRLWLTDDALWRIAQIARAVGHDEPFDVDDLDTVGAVFSEFPLVGTLKMNGEWPEVEGFDGYTPFGGEPKDEWEQTLDTAQERYNAWRAKKTGGGSGGSSRSSSSGSYSKMPF